MIQDLKPTSVVAKVGRVTVERFRGSVRIRFTLKGTTYNHTVGKESARILKAARKTAEDIDNAIALGLFDDYWQNLKSQGTGAASLRLVSKGEVDTTNTISLMELWDRYIEFKRPGVSPNTYQKTYIRCVKNTLKRCGLDTPNEAQALRDWLAANTPPYTAKRILVQLNACAEWGIRSNLLYTNPFEGMAKDITIPKSDKGKDRQELDIKAFTRAERDLILDTFRTWERYSYYHPYVYFLFFTGARPSEVTALQWRHDKGSHILFEQGVVDGEFGLEVRQGLKTQEHRRFPINKQLRTFLDSIKPNNASANDLIFPSPEGRHIDQHNFCNRAWKSVLGKCGVEYRNPYQTRHTFITLTLDATLPDGSKIDVKDVAKWVGNTPEVIYKHYASNRRDLIVPEL
ncbi:MAG: site-specific integrase [Synechococcaceae cyanobacterium SM2_3_2]|nr:site-specific integrase [Synechococcaceae cyanobacterium SM2_3_2]